MSEQTEVDVDALLRNIRGQFYTDLPEKRFHQDRNVLMLAITWPAQWLHERGVTWSGERYFRTLRDLLVEIKRHGATAQIKFFPGYLLKCVQDHFAPNSDAYCEEGRQARHTWERALGRAVASAAPSSLRQDEEKIAVLAEAHRVLAVRRKPAKAAKTDDSQGTLF